MMNRTNGGTLQIINSMKTMPRELLDELEIYDKISQRRMEATQGGDRTHGCHRPGAPGQ